MKTDFYVVSQQLNKNFEIKDKTLLKLLLEKIEDCEDVVVRRVGNDVNNVLDISKDDIDLCLNHVNEAHKMADVYIDKDFTRIDQANRRMIDLLMGKEEK